MGKILKKIAFSLLLLLPLWGDTLRVGLSSGTASLYGEFQIGLKPIFARIHGLYVKDGDNWGGVGFMTQGPFIGYPNLNVSLFVDGVHSQNRNALPIGVGFNYWIPYAFLPLSIRGEFEYANNLLTFGDADRFSRGVIEIGVQIIENGELFLGYRNLRWDSPFKSNWYLGVGFMW
ncbi:MAG: hypothetical protein C6I01_02925 [Epsilonproteobacteria bacterium]|nr:hypothetical protein [Campylobacterota bacterium]NPA89787.1 hypothetical protein [Campylobacterota bacterium]